MDDWQDDISDLLEDEIYDPKPESTPSNLTRINWIGIPTGILMIILPFLGGWWQFTIGDEAIITTLSPFEVDMFFFGEVIPDSPLLFWLLFALKIGMVFYGMILLFGSIIYALDNNSKMVADELVRFSSIKLFWVVIPFVLILLLVILIGNGAPEFFNLILGDIIIEHQGNIPYLIGKGELNVKLDGAQFMFPIHMEFLNTFALAALVLILGASSHFYQKRLPKT